MLLWDALKWTEEKGVPMGQCAVVFKSVHDVPQLVLRLHSNPDDWDWVVKREGQCYTHKHNGIKIEEVLCLGWM